MRCCRLKSDKGKGKDMKKLLSTCLAVLMLLSSLSIMASAELDLYQNIDKDDTYTVGDVNGDKAVTPNAKDSNLIKSYFLGRAAAENSIIKNAADINADGVINSKDSFLLKSIIAGTKTPEDFGNDKQVYKLTVGGVDISEFSIYAPEPEGSNNNATYAAELMRKYIRVATGVELGEVKTGTPEGHAIVFNKIERDTELGQALGTEGYQYKVENGSLYVYGTYRGNMYAVYEILENYLGYRFYDSNHTFIYKSRIVDIPEGLDSGIFQPAMKFRYCGQNVRGNNAQVYYYPSRMNGTQISGWAEERYGTQYGPQFINAHSYGYYWQMSLGKMPPDDGTMNLSERYNVKLAEGREKWDADPNLDELNWQPCASSESDYKMLFDGMIDTITMISEGWRSAAYDFTGRAKEYVQDGQKSMSFSLCDNESYCSCRKCRSKAKKEGYSGLYIDLANRAVRELQEYDGGKYAGMRVHCILYNHDIPQTVRPDKNLIVFFCGQGCNNHFLGTEDCGTCKGQRGIANNIDTNASLKAWGAMCKETGAEMWFWYYGVTYHYVLVGMPNVLNLYHDIKFLYDECNVRGIYYEGGGRTYNFGKLKEYLAMKMMWEPTMTYDQYTDHIKEYLYMYYGDGAEYLYQLILMQDEAAKKCGTCFISNFDRPGDMYSVNYMRTHYEDMRNLIVSALELADKPEYRERLETMLYCFDLFGLSYVYHDVYKGETATAETKALYEQRYTEMYNYIKSKNLDVFSDSNTYKFPAGINFDICPIVQVYGGVNSNGIVYSDASRRIPINNFFLTGTKPDINDGEPDPTEIEFGNMTIKY